MTRLPARIGLDVLGGSFDVDAYCFHRLSLRSQQGMVFSARECIGIAHDVAGLGHHFFHGLAPGRSAV